MPDPWFPALHIRPERGWLNDPNGVCLVDGVHHVFFQHQPYEPVHAAVHWGHARSTDLLHWTYEPIALTPQPGGIDAVGCWSGCVVDDAGVPTAVYTAVPDHAWNAGVALATGDRTLQSWRQQAAYVLGPPTGPDVDEVRDPFVFTHLGRRFAVQGAGQRLGRPQLLLYGCDNLQDWVPLGPLLTDDDPVAAEVAAANIWECPNLALVDGRWVLLVSLWRWRDETHELAGVRYLLGDLEPAGAGLRFRARAGGTVDDGPAFYAPQLLAGAERTLLWGWAWEIGRSEEQVRATGWAGALTFPRELFVTGETLGSRPAAELTGLRRNELAWAPGVPVTERAFEVLATGPVRLLTGAHGGTLVAAATGTPANPARLLVDASLVETFAAGRVATTRAYLEAGEGWLVQAAAGDVMVFRLGL